MGVQRQFSMVIKGYSHLYLHDTIFQDLWALSRQLAEREREPGENTLFHAVKFFFLENAVIWLGPLGKPFGGHMAVSATDNSASTLCRDVHGLRTFYSTSMYDMFWIIKTASILTFY